MVLGLDWIESKGPNGSIFDSIFLYVLLPPPNSKGFFRVFVVVFAMVVEELKKVCALCSLNKVGFLSPIFYPRVIIRCNFFLEALVLLL